MKAGNAPLLALVAHHHEEVRVVRHLADAVPAGIQALFDLLRRQYIWIAAAVTALCWLVRGWLA